MPVPNPSSGCNLSCSQNALLCNLSCSVQSGTHAPLFRWICDAEGQRHSTECQHPLGISRKLESPSLIFVFWEISKFLAHGLHLFFFGNCLEDDRDLDEWVIFLVWNNKWESCWGCRVRGNVLTQRLNMTSTISFPSVFSTWGRSRMLGRISLFYFIKIVVTPLYHREWLSNFTSSLTKKLNTSWKGDNSLFWLVLHEEDALDICWQPLEVFSSSTEINQIDIKRNSFESRLDLGIVMAE